MIDLSQYSFLVVDDSPVNQAILLHRLTKLGGKVALADNGNEAIAQCQRNSFDLIFLDIQMPELDGFATARKLREDYPELKIVAWTCSIDDSAVSFFDAGFDGQLEKPIFKQSFFNILNELLELERSPDAVEDLNAEFIVSELTVHAKEILAAHSGFITSLPERIIELDALIELQAWEELGFQARKLRGTAKLNGLAHLAEMLRTIELAANSTSPPSASKPLNVLSGAVARHLRSTLQVEPPLAEEVSRSKY